MIQPTIQPTKLPDFDWTEEEVEPTESNLSDAAFLERFQSHQDQTAFETLVSRHGHMVHDVCRSILKSPADADDAFQETFLVLAKKKTIQSATNRPSHAGSMASPVEPPKRPESAPLLAGSMNMAC